MSSIGIPPSKRIWFELTFRQKRGRQRYDGMRCPHCEGPIQHIPEGPGSAAGKVCQPCHIVWSQEGSGRLRIHPYASCL